MDFSGRVMVSALASLALNRPDRFAQIRENLRVIVPAVKQIRFDQVTTWQPVQREMLHEGKLFQFEAHQQVPGYAIIFDMEGADAVPGHMVSDGALLVLGILTAIETTTSPRLLLCDDIDHGLHPQAQRELVVLLHRLLDQNDDLQLIATTHSPYLLDHFDPKEVRLTTRRDDGSVAIGRLDQHPDFERWKEAMRPGEFWSAVGEKWVAEPQLQEVGP
jgi:predicted ATPase